MSENIIIVSKSKQTKKKQVLGQFYTTNQEYILQDIKIPSQIKNIIEPFTGDGDLLNSII